MSVKTIRGLLSGLVFHSKARGVSECTSDFHLQKMLEGWSRESGSHRDDWRPITPEMLSSLWATWHRICSNEFEVSLFHAASLVTFFCALRISELVALSKSDRLMRDLFFQDVWFSDT